MSDAPPSPPVPCPHVLRLPILGVEVDFASNATAVLDQIEAAWGGWASLRRRPGVVQRSGPRARVVVEEGVGDERVGDVGPGDGGAGGEGPDDEGVGRGGEGNGGVGGEGEGDEAAGNERGTARAVAEGVGHPGRGTGRPDLRVLDRIRIRIAGPGGRGGADTTRMEAWLRIAPALLARPRELAEGWIEPLTLFLLGRCDREPVHAAAVVEVGDQQFSRKAHEGARSARRHQQFPRKAHEGPVALLLAAPSGTGKSTLAYAAYRGGRFRVLADEPTYVQLRPRLRVWGRRGRLHLPADARTRFPELRGRAATQLPTGKAKIVVEAGAGLPFAERVGLCLLARGRRAGPELEAVSTDDAVAELTASLDPGYDLFADTIGERIARVAAAGCWRLHLGRDPEATVPLLAEAAAAVREGASG